MFHLHMYALIIGFLLDLVFGDPQWLYHPIRLIGHLIQWTEKKLRPLATTPKKEVWCGALLVVVVLVVSTAIPAVIVFAVYQIHVGAGLAVESILCYQMLAMKCLKTESMKVYDALMEADLEKARFCVSMIVGRDTSVLNEMGITKAAIETVAENTSDGVIAPLVFMALGGPVCGVFYKTVNTMDSMIGYKNERYLHFGRVAAKLDDVLNYIPARIAGLLMVFASYFAGYDGKNACKIYLRDRKKHASPNSAHTEAACAGALRIQLAGNAVYFGKVYEKPTIGDPIRSVETEDIKRANRLLYCTSMVVLVVLLCIDWGIKMVF